MKINGTQISQLVQMIYDGNTKGVTQILEKNKTADNFADVCHQLIEIASDSGDKVSKEAIQKFSLEKNNNNNNENPKEISTQPFATNKEIIIGPWIRKPLIILDNYARYNYFNIQKDAIITCLEISYSGANLLCDKNSYQIQIFTEDGAFRDRIYEMLNKFNSEMDNKEHEGIFKSKKGITIRFYEKNKALVEALLDKNIFVENDLIGELNLDLHRQLNSLKALANDLKLIYTTEQNNILNQSARTDFNAITKIKECFESDSSVVIEITSDYNIMLSFIDLTEALRVQTLLLHLGIRSIGEPNKPRNIYINGGDELSLKVDFKAGDCFNIYLTKEEFGKIMGPNAYEELQVGVLFNNFQFSR